MKSEFEFNLPAKCGKKILAILLSLAMCISMFAGTVFAEETDYDEMNADTQAAEQSADYVSAEESDMEEALPEVSDENASESSEDTQTDSYDDAEELQTSEYEAAEEETAETVSEESYETEAVSETAAVENIEETTEVDIEELADTSMDDVLSTENVVSVSLTDGSTLKYEFTPQTTGGYRINISETADDGDDSVWCNRYPQLYDSSMNQLAGAGYDWYPGIEQESSSVDYRLEAGQTYYFWITSSGHESTANISVEFVGDYSFTVYYYDSPAASFDAYLGTDSAVTVPDTYEGYPVTSIGQEAFRNNSSLKSVTIPEGVTSIGYGAFQGCSNLTDVTLPSSLTEISGYAFFGTGLTSISIPKEVNYIGEKAFGYFYSTETWGEVSVSDFTITGYETSAAETYADNNDFDFESLGSSLDGELSTETAVTDALTDGSTLKYEFTPQTTGGYRIKISDTASASDDTEQCSRYPKLFDSSMVKLAGSFYYEWYPAITQWDCYSIDYRLEAGQTYYLWITATGPESTVDITVEYVGDYAFTVYDTDNVASFDAYLGTDSAVTIPDTYEGYPVTIIGSEAFCNNSTLTSVIIPEGVTEIGYEAFYNCANLTSVVLPDSLTCICGDAFRRCVNLTSVSLPESLELIYDYAFYETGLTSVYLPKSVTSIGSYAFGYIFNSDTYENVAVSDFTISGYEPSAAKTYADDNGFDFVSLGTPADGELILDTPVSIATGDSLIYSFTADETGFYEITLTESSYDENDGYKSVYIWSSTDLTLNGPGEQEIYSYGGQLYGKVVITADAGTEYYVRIRPADGYSFTGTAVIEYAGNYNYSIYFDDDMVNGYAVINDYYGDDSQIVIPATLEGQPVKEIRDNAFCGCYELTDVTLPEFLTTIGNGAFYNTGLTSVSIPKSVTSIGESAFGYTSKTMEEETVSGFKIYGYVPSAAQTYADDNSFDFESLGSPLDGELSTETTVSAELTDGSALQYEFTPQTTGGYRIHVSDSINDSSVSENAVRNITLYDSDITYLDEANYTIWASYGTEQGEADLYYRLEEGQTYYLWITATGAESTAEITAELAGDYAYTFNEYDKTATISKYLGADAVVVIPASYEGYTVTSIGSEAFANNDTLTSVTIPEGMKKISSEAFMNCTSLKDVALPDSLTSIYYSAFYNTGLTSVSVPKNVAYIGYRAFGYVFNENEGMDEKTEGFTISGFEPSAAKTYADDNDFSFVSLGSSLDGNITVDDPAQVNLNVEVRKAYSFTPDADGAYRFTFEEGSDYSTDYHYINIEVYDGSNNIKNCANGNNGAAKVAVSAKLTAGTTYYIYITAYNQNCSGTLSVKALGDYDYTVSAGTATITAYYGDDTAVKIPAQIDGYNVTAIGSGAFEAHMDITSVEIPEGVTSIGSSAFYACSSLSQVALPSSLVSISYYAFTGAGLTEITIPEGVTTLNYMCVGYADYSTAAENFVIKGYSPSMAENYADSNNFEFVPLGDSSYQAVTEEDTSIKAAAGRSVIYSFTPDTDGAYRIEIYEDVKYSENLHGVTLKLCDEDFNTISTVIANLVESSSGQATVTGNGVAGSSYRLDAVTSAELTADETYYVIISALTENFAGDLMVSKLQSDYNYLIDRDENTAAVDKYYGSDTDITIPQTIEGVNVTEVGGSGSVASGLTSLTIPEGVTGIGNTAFSNGNADLTVINLPDSLEMIGMMAFANTGITSITLPDSLKRIDYGAFTGTGLTSITIPAGIEYIGYNAFGSNITSIVYKGTQEQWDNLYNTAQFANATVTFEPEEEHTHTVVTDEAVEATCTESGLTEGSHCSVCGETLVAQEEIPALGHTYKADETVPATYNTLGYTVYKCINCDDSYKSDLTDYVDGWAKINDIWYYYTDGQAKTGWLYASGCWYYMDSDGCMSVGWKYINGTWYYLQNSGAMATGWLKVGETWYYFNGSGAMATGWLKIGGTWYYFNASGAMATGWLKIGGTWYYFNASGAMVTGWLKVGETWYYFNASGAMATGWLKVGETWYYFNASGAMATGWLKVGETWYYFNGSGAMATGWLKVGETWYYFNGSGAMVTGTQTISGTKYTFNSSGALVS